MTPEHAVPASETFSHVPQYHVQRGSDAAERLQRLSPEERKRIRRFVARPARIIKRLYALPEAEIAKYFHLSQREAARVFGVATFTLKHICRRRGINWPALAAESAESSANESLEIGLNVSHAPAAPLGVVSNAAELRSRL